MPKEIKIFLAIASVPFIFVIILLQFFKDRFIPHNCQNKDTARNMGGLISCRKDFECRKNTNKNSCEKNKTCEWKDCEPYHHWCGLKGSLTPC